MENIAGELTRENLVKKEVVIGKNRYFFAKMPFSDSIKVFDKITNALASNVEEARKVLDTEVDEAMAIGLVLVKVLGGLSEDFRRDLRVSMFAYVKCSINGETPTTVLHNEDKTFAEGGPVEAYQVLIRALAVNFMSALPESLFLQSGEG